MCGRFAQGEFPASIRKMIKDIIDEAVKDYNIAPSGSAAAILREPAGEPESRRMTWGIAAPWERDPVTAPRLINARSETIASKPSFRNAFQHRRCLIPAIGFYEWQRIGPSKTPFCFSAASEERPLVMGGIWETYADTRNFLIITTGANSVMRPVHDRMPVIIPPEHWLDWLDPHRDDAQLITSLMLPAPDDYLQRWQVSPYVNNTRAKGETCILPIR